jgi:hypothetical protein
MSRLSEWRRYEAQIADWARQLVGDTAEVQTNVKMPGRQSGVDRQVDVLVTGAFAGGAVKSATAVIDAKLYGRKLNVSEVGAFASLVEDVGADFGVLVTNEGFSAAAQRLAQRRRIRLQI